MDVPLLKTLVNRSTSGEFEMPADGWYLISPKGEFPHGVSGLIQVIDDTAVQKMANSFAPGSELLIDFEHESHDQNKRTTAAGWIQNLAARTDGLYAQIHWSKSGVEAVRGGDYRYISPVWNRSDCENLGQNRVRPLRLADAGLTNRPNLVGIAALSNRGTEPGVNEALNEGPDFPAAKLLNDAVKDIQSMLSCSFEHAWEVTCEREPTLLANAMRAQPSALRNTDDRVVPTLTWPDGQNPSVRFNSIVQNHAALKRVTYETAFEAAKLSHPNEYAQMLSQWERDEKSQKTRL